MDDLQVRDASGVEEQEERELCTYTLDGLSEAEAKKFKVILQRFLNSYKEKAPDVSLEDWLTKQFETELPEVSKEEAKKLSRETIASVEQYDKNLEDLQAAAAKGKPKEHWLADKLQEASAGMAVADYGRKLAVADSALQTANEQMHRTILRKDGEISQSLNLDGFIAEQAHVSSFNEVAALKGEPFRAEVCVPDGAYGKNSFDVVVKDTRTGRIVHQYQMKYGADADATIAMIKRGNYNNQVLVVPPDQVEAVKAAFPGKTVVSYIGGGDIPIKSNDLSKEAAKQLQKEAQEKGILPTENWNSYNTRELAVQLGKNAAVAGLQGAVIGTGFHLAAKLFSDEEIDGDEVLQTALTTGADAGVKSAAAGALTVASRGTGPLSKVIPAGTAVGTIANIACVAVENIKVLGKVATGELTMAEGLDRMGQTTTAMCCGIACAPGAAVFGAAALSWIPLIGPVVGGALGGILGYTAGSKFGETVFNGAKKIVKAGVGIVKRAAGAVINAGRKIASGIRNFFSSIFG